MVDVAKLLCHIFVSFCCLTKKMFADCKELIGWLVGCIEDLSRLSSISAI